MEGQALVSRPQNQRLQVNQAKAVTQPQVSVQPGLEAHRIWPIFGSHLSFLLLQSHLPPDSSLNTDTLLPLHIWRLHCLERPSPKHPCGHSFMSFTSLLKGHFSNEAHCPP